MKNQITIIILLINCVISGQDESIKKFISLNNSSELILSVEAGNTNSRWITNNNYKHIFTLAEFEVKEVIKGFYSGEKLDLEIIGGTVGDTTEYVFPSFTFRNSERSILFLSRDRYKSGYKILDKIPIADNKIYFNERFYQAEGFISLLKKSSLGEVSIPETPEKFDEIIHSLELKKENINQNLLNKSLTGEKSQQSLINLTPYQPSNWSAPLVVSTITGNNVDASAIKETEKLYIDFAVANYGPDNTASSFYISLYIDNLLQAQWVVNELPAGYYVYLTDFEVDPLSRGSHQVKISVDPTNKIPETDETDNEHIKSLSIEAVQGLPSITDIFPSSVSAGTSSTVRITGSDFGATRNSSRVMFFYKSGEPKIESSNYIFWSDTQIECEVPVGIINDYPASASSGPVTVETPSGASAGYNVNITFGYGGVKWDGSSPSVPLKINDNTNDLNGEANEIIAAINTWNNAGSNFGLYYNGKTNVIDATFDGINQILWGTTSGSLATAYYWSVGNNIIEADIVFNDSYNWSSDGTNFDVQSLALHELGHWLSLRDLYGGGDSGKIMYGFGSSGFIKRVLTTSETDGIRYIYGSGSPSPAAPQLSSPQNQSTGISINPILFWNPASGTGITYRLQVSLSNNFSNTVADISNLPNTQQQLSNLTYNTKYYWRVNATNSTNQTSNWSDIWDFTTSQQMYTVTCIVNPGQGGTASGGGTFTSGSQVTLTANPNQGYQFLNWTEGANVLSANSTYTFTLSSDRTITANFAEQMYTVTCIVNPVQGGSTSGGGTYSFGSEITLTANPSQGYQFLNWTEGANVLSANSTYTFTLLSDRTITANFEEQMYTVNCVVNPAQGGSTSGGGTYSFGSEITLTANPNQGYQFLNWTEGVNVLSANSTYTFTLSSDRTITANFVVNSTLSLLEPNGSENWLSGTTNRIKWSSENVVSAKIEYTTDNGNTWQTIASPIPASTGLYDWLIPRENNASAKIKITDLNNGVEDISDNPFNIQGINRGDTNDDGMITPIDAVYVLRYIVGLETLTIRQQYSADANLDNLIQAYDSYFILYYVLNGLWP